MRIRKDGVQTRKRILEAACQIFSEKGYSDSTVEAICKLAGANTAAINYHFRDKETLYVEVWKHVLNEGLRIYPYDGGVPIDAPAEDRLRGHISSLLKRISDDGRMGYVHRLHMMEMVQPTGLIDDVHKEFRGPLREHLIGAIRELLGGKASDEDLRLCELSVISQCRSVHPRPDHKKEMPGFGLITPELIEKIADHITRFSLAGIYDKRNQIEAKGEL